MFVTRHASYLINFDTPYFILLGISSFIDDDWMDVDRMSIALADEFGSNLSNSTKIVIQDRISYLD